MLAFEIYKAAATCPAASASWIGATILTAGTRLGTHLFMLLAKHLTGGRILAWSAPSSLSYYQYKYISL
jgi:hypothetical protein